ncbi:hypothetical protein CONLIGDRAFT_294352 [Coniochaeta ligniaria NRRL 30616]|uniref:Uncharacterized protein n=1 Tax=Coniochaeta ligniaria NRRL 30616 TaxID=1408157 RepID=A0A1J7JC90_9PEZI|nr:hypothetical protein CONLIGDRAFT_294352 [Coniochaeta ligniaria NRRL 30616]
MFAGRALLAITASATTNARSWLSQDACVQEYTAHDYSIPATKSLARDAARPVPYCGAVRLWTSTCLLSVIPSGQAQTKAWTCSSCTTAKLRHWPPTPAICVICQAPGTQAATGRIPESLTRVARDRDLGDGMSYLPCAVRMASSWYSVFLSY